ncbi:hypothetical protein D3C78_1556280 [compost metagenome]
MSHYDLNGCRDEQHNDHRIFEILQKQLPERVLRFALQLIVAFLGQPVIYFSRRKPACGTADFFQGV